MTPGTLGLIDTALVNSDMLGCFNHFVYSGRAIHHYGVISPSAPTPVLAD